MIKSLEKLVLAVILDLLILYVIYVFSIGLPKQLMEEYRDARAMSIYNELVKKTGMFTEIPSLTIVKNPIINAYATSRSIVVFTGLLDAAPNEDAVAAVLAHEIAHVTLKHVNIVETPTDLEIIHMEANADKLGAFYMMAAGYDICEARKFWKQIKDQKGDYLGGDHPGYAYRYAELNVQCGEE